jgi:hypothetical protein
MHPKHLDQCGFPSRFYLICCLLLSLLPRVVAACWHIHQLAEQAQWVTPLRLDKAITVHCSGVCESLRLK